MADRSVLHVPTAAPYDVVLGTDLRGELPALLGETVRKVAVIHPHGLASYGAALLAGLDDQGYDAHVIEVPDGEPAKTAEVASRCWQELGRCGLTRGDAVVTVGGGSTTDLGGFVAATWLRGVRVVHLPTTLLGMVDAAIGAKTGINTAEGKNLVGAFHEPAGVLCDLDALRTLPHAEIRSGLAEVVKCGFVADPAILDLVETDPAAAANADPAVLRELVERAIRVKIEVVTGDPHETGGRTGEVGREVLNYGHTLGHAIERVEGYRLRHGEAVAVGMVFVAELARLAGLLAGDVAQRHRSVLEAVGLPTTYAGGSWPELLDGMRVDKKTRGDRLRLVVLEALARPVVLTAPDEKLLAAAYARIAG